MTAVVGTQVDCEALQGIAARLFGYPSAGVHRGGGVCVPMTTERHGNLLRHPTVTTNFAYPIDPDLVAASRDSRANRLTAPERTTLDARILAAVTLTSDWFPTPL